jgi:predicted MPP superfamily phosphohydrolase
MTFSTLARQLPLLWQDEGKRRLALQGAGLLAGLGAGIAGYAFLHEPLTVRLDHQTIRLAKGRGRLPKRGLRILHLSDTHFQGQDWRELPKIEQIRRATAGLEYDLLVHTGDFLQDDRGVPNVLALLDALPKPRLGGFAVFGNHDYMTYSHSQLLTRSWQHFREEESRNGNGHTHSLWDRMFALLRFGYYFLHVPFDMKRTGSNDIVGLEAALRARGIEPLHNRSVHLCYDGGPDERVDIHLAGVDDLVEGVADVREATSCAPDDCPLILLSHNPDVLWEDGVERACLVLCGHTHGGQIVLPIFGAAHTQSVHLRRHEVAGHLRRGETQAYITRGVGEGIPIRFGATPQVTLITVLPE